MICQVRIASVLGATAAEPGADLILLLLVLSLLVEYELLVAYFGGGYRKRLWPLLLALVPLLPVVSFIVVVRAIGLR
ncbi:MAG: hypothetical protein H0V68_01570 [Actinobacteria bacterium]|nr:hypothetical protein [Actinomycetota bacterium]